MRRDGAVLLVNDAFSVLHPVQRADGAVPVGDPVDLVVLVDQPEADSEGALEMERSLTWATSVGQLFIAEFGPVWFS